MKKLGSDDFYDLYDIEEDISEGSLMIQLGNLITQNKCSL
jgi:hypothetical protein